MMKFIHLGSIVLPDLVDRYSRIAEKIQEMDTDRLIELKKPRLAHREEIF